MGYAGEAYDAVVIAALAAEYAHSTDPSTVAKQLVGVTVGGTMCETVSTCLTLARQGKDLRYRGVTLRRGGLTDAGEPSAAQYGVVSYGRDNHIDSTRTEFVVAGDERSESQGPVPPPARSARPTGVLRIGGLLPHTGRLASFGPPLTAGITLAISEINTAGGVLSRPVEWVDGDDGTNIQTALSTLERLVGAGVQVVIGPGSSGVTKAILPRIVSTGRVLISPTATSDELVTADDAGLFFRTAPPDSLQAKALTNVLMRDGPKRVAIVAIDEAWGAGLAQSVQSDLLLAGMSAHNIRLFLYPAKDRYDPVVDLPAIFNPIGVQVKKFGPDAVLVVGSDESAYAVRMMLP